MNPRKHRACRRRSPASRMVGRLPARLAGLLGLAFALFFGGLLGAQDAAPVPFDPFEPIAPAVVAPDEQAAGANSDSASLSIQLGGGDGAGDVSVALQLVLVMTLLTLAPSLVVLMTCFTRIVIVLGFVRTALGVPSAPANQVIIGLSLFLTVFIMGPILDQVYEEAIEPHLAEEISARDAIDRAAVPLKDFMLRQTRTDDLEFFLQLGRFPPTRVDDLPMRVVVPAFIISELQTAFQMGFLLFLPFLVIDFLVSSILMSLGMMMMPPVIVSLPFKLLLFVLVDGWYLVVRGLVESFN